MELGRMAAIQDPSGARVNLWQPGRSIGSVRVNEPGCPIWHELTCADLPAATAFYSEVLGVGWEAMPMETGDDYTCLMVDGRPVGGAFPPTMDGIPPHWEVYLNVTDADATAEQATGLGGRVLQEPWDVPGVGRMAILMDPQGAVLGLMQNPSDADG
jgi:predicted enzyme related to lactoylglutathione lyase